MSGVKFKLCSIILVFLVTNSMGSRVRQLSSSYEDPLKVLLPTDHKIPKKFNVLRQTDGEVNHDQYLDTDTNDFDDKTRKKRQHITDVLIPDEYYKILKLRDSYKTPNEMLPISKCKQSQLWKDRLENLIPKKFVPYKQYYDYESGKYTNYYKTQLKNDFNIDQKRNYFTLPNDNKLLHPNEPFHQDNMQTFNLRIQTDNKKESDNFKDQVQELDNEEKPVDKKNADRNAIHEVVGKLEGTTKNETISDSLDSNRSKNDDSLFISSGTYSTSNVSMKSTQNSILENNQKIINPRGKFDSLNKHHLDLLPSASHQTDLSNTFSKPTHPFNTADIVSESYNAVYKYRPPINVSYFTRPDKKLITPYTLHKRPYNWYNKDKTYQLPKLYHFDRHSFSLPSKNIQLHNIKVKETPQNKYYENFNSFDEEDIHIHSHVPDNLSQSKGDLAKQLVWPYEKSEPGSSYYSPSYQTVRPIVKDAECREGTEWASSCHRCYCKHGEAVCEEIKNCKLKPFGKPMLCKPYSRFKLDNYYECECNGDGIPECSFQDCKHDKTRNALEVSKKLYDGSTEEWLYNKRQSDCPRQELPTCEQWTVWTSSCHECTCNENGRRECVKLIGCQLNPKNYGKPAKCQPNSTFQPRLSMLCQEYHCDDEGRPYCILPRNVLS